MVDGELVMVVGPWREIEFSMYSNDDLLASVASVPELFADRAA